jgi:4,5-dihydroxyphthalate decarboxylase
MKPTRRDFLKLGTLAGIGLVTDSASGADPAPRAPGSQDNDLLDLQVSGYAFEHVRPLIDGEVQIAGCKTTFRPGKIGDLNTHVFSGPRSLDVTEIGLSPFMLAYANDGFRA